MTKNQHIMYGLHSGIPSCCITFYVTDYDREFGLKTPYYTLITLLGWGYVPCPHCVVNNAPVKIKDCMKECGRNCALDYQQASGETKPLTNEITWDII